MSYFLWHFNRSELLGIAFDNIFMLMGQFRMEMAFFNAIGKFIAESGILIRIDNSW